MLGSVPELDDELAVPTCEVHLDSNGVVTLTGFPPDELRVLGGNGTRATPDRPTSDIQARDGVNACPPPNAID